MLVAELLRAHGFSAVTARDAGLLGKDDVDQLRYAVRQARTILTHNRDDFQNLAEDYFATGKMHYASFCRDAALHLRLYAACCLSSIV
ncbi:MAG TPA: DUF5615 family PIN-like protein [Chloroflexia bacterium]|nr:DUF5615 family PIN-like protein [Chloroflexia bacterium]